MTEDYKAMYLTLFNKVTEVIEELKKVQAQTEDLYINARENKSDEQ